MDPQSLQGDLLPGRAALEPRWQAETALHRAWEEHSRRCHISDRFNDRIDIERFKICSATYVSSPPSQPRLHSSLSAMMPRQARPSCFFGSDLEHPSQPFLPSPRPRGPYKAASCATHRTQRQCKDRMESEANKGGADKVLSKSLENQNPDPSASRRATKWRADPQSTLLSIWLAEGLLVVPLVRQLGECSKWSWY